MDRGVPSPFNSYVGTTALLTPPPTPYPTVIQLFPDLTVLTKLLINYNSCSRPALTEEKKIVNYDSFLHLTYDGERQVTKPSFPLQSCRSYDVMFLKGET